MQELDVGDAVDDAAAGVRREILGKIRQHLGRDAGAQRGKIFCAVGGLDFTEQPLERVVIRLPDRDAPARKRVATTGLPLRAGARHNSAQQRCTARVGRRMAPLVPDPDQAGDEEDQRDLQQKPENRGKAAEEVVQVGHVR